MSLTCDITGNNPLYLIKNLRYRITTTGTSSVKVSFPQAAYPSSVVIKKINADGSLSTLARGMDYVFDACEDIESENLVRGAYPSFSSRLDDGCYVKYATFGGAAFMDIVIEFQSAFPNILSSALDTAGNPGGPSCTPELLRQMVLDIVALKGYFAGNNTNTFATATQLPSPLFTDYTGELDDNYIVDEEHYVDSVSGKVIVRPSNGAFYGHDVILKDKDGTTLVLDTDYTIRGMDIGSTKVCEHESGVWRYLVVTLASNYSGKLLVSYHAFGGEVSVSNFVSLQNDFIELRNYVNTGNFLTSDSVSGTAIMQDVMERLKTLDRYFRSLNMSGYRDMSTRFLATNNDADGLSHWYKVAYLYKQASVSAQKEVIQLVSSNILAYIGKTLPMSSTATGEFIDVEITASHVGKYVMLNSTLLDQNDNDYFTTYTKDSVRLKIRLEKTGIFFDLFVYANVKTGILKIHAVEADTDNGYAEPNSYRNIGSVVVPQFRLVWRKDGSYGYGAVLQMKFPLPTGATNEVVVVENHNKAGMGGWILNADNISTNNIEPEDNTVQLPDQLHAWINGGDGNIYGSTSIYPSFKEGTMVWAGSIPMSLMDPEGGDVQTLDKCISGTIDVTSVKNISIVVFDRYDGTYRTFTEEVNAVGTHVATEFAFDGLDMSMLRVDLGSDSIQVWAILGTKSLYMDKFDLRQILINKETEE